MPTQRYSVTQPPIENIFTWIKSGDIAIPEIQRPFVWKATKVRNFLDSLYQGYPVGYLIAWRNPDVKLKDGSTSAGKRILIDGQQRVTALMAALLGHEVIDKDYQRVRIKIAFHPVDCKFEVSNPAIEKDCGWIADVSTLFDPNTKMFELVNTYCSVNEGTSQDEIFRCLELLRGITSNQIGLIELNSDLDIETVTEIFIRVNSEGVPLSQADFAMSKIAVNESYGGNALRKAIDYFCHLAVAPEFYPLIEKHDPVFVKSEFFPKMTWLRSENDDLYDPSYTDMLRVAYTSEFKRGRLEDLVALLSGRNFETKQFEETIVEDSFARLKKGIIRFMNETHFKRFIMIIRSAGFVDTSLIGSQNTLNFAYILYLTLRELNCNQAKIEQLVRKWFVLSVLTSRYSSSPETQFDIDIRRMYEQGPEEYINNVISAELSDVYWTIGLPQSMDTSVASSPIFNVFLAAQVKMNDKGFLSKDITVKDLLELKGDIHHIYPKNYLKKQNYNRGMYNQIGNYVMAQSEINIAIGDKEPEKYFSELKRQGETQVAKYGAIIDMQQLKENLQANCIPLKLIEGETLNYEDFLKERRFLMANKIKEYFALL